MRTVKTQDLTPGMITAEPVLSKHGQLIVAADTELTNQMIAHLSYYNIPSASILDGTIPPAAIASMQKTEQVTLSYSQKIRSSRSFQRFKSDYVKKIRFLKSSLNDLIDRTDPIDQAELLSESVGLFGKQSTTISIFDNLHNMRQIDDSTYAHCLNVSIISRMFGMWLKYSDEDLDRILAGKIARERRKLTESISSQLAAELDERECNILKRELRADAREKLAADGLPPGLSDCFSYESKEAFDNSYSSIVKAFKEALSAGMNDRMRGHTPKAVRSSSFSGDRVRDAFARKD